MPDYFEEMDEEEKVKYSGDVNLVTQYFNVDKSQIEKFLVIWPEEDDEYEEDDEISEYYFDEWAVTSFMKALGYEYPQ